MTQTHRENTDSKVATVIDSNASDIDTSTAYTDIDTIVATDTDRNIDTK